MKPPGKGANWLFQADQRRLILWQLVCGGDGFAGNLDTGMKEDVDLFEKKVD